MPTYSYICDGCGESFEIEQRISEDPIKKCVHCGKPKARRQIISGNFILKGGGWYSDGYGSGSNSSNSKKADTASSSKSDKADKADKAEGGKSESSSAGSKSSETKAQPA